MRTYIQILNFKTIYDEWLIYAKRKGPSLSQRQAFKKTNFHIKLTKGFQMDYSFSGTFQAPSPLYLLLFHNLSSEVTGD